MSVHQLNILEDHERKRGLTSGQDLRAVAGAFDRALTPWFAIHDLWWEKLLETAGRAGWSATMVQLQYAVAMSVPMLETAGRRAQELGPEWAPFSEWCFAHAVEERDHDRWLLDDLVRIGTPIEEGGGRRPGDPVAGGIPADVGSLGPPYRHPRLRVCHRVPPF